MRAFLLPLVAPLVAMVALGAGCSDGTLGEDTAYRRLVDQFDTYDQCLAEGDFTVCYQTLTLCDNGIARIDLERRPQDGSYELDEADNAVAEFATMGTVVFDLEAATSSQLPGRHPWELVTPELYDCVE